MARRALPKIEITQELKNHYKAVGVFLKANSEIQWRKLALGFEVNIGTIPKHLISEWLEVSAFEHND
jgi:hypothetical protein